jgi:hypothetical protein
MKNINLAICILCIEFFMFQFLCELLQIKIEL